MEVCKNLDRQKNVAEIELCAKYFRQAGLLNARNGRKLLCSLSKTLAWKA